MPTNLRAALKEIRTFPSLVRYLRDAMGWPIDAGDFEALTFEYTAEELGIDAKNAAKIEEIKRLRPLATGQPWGIFFVKFERKKLPVVALRRILSQVALKKRASANSAERTAWAADDLLFVSNYGEGDERQISFAHFSKAADGHDLPTLKVLGWDNLDTALHLDDVAEKLTTNLAWPKNEKDPEAWREQWRAAFTLRHREVVATSKELSIRLAELARAIRDRIKTALAIETETGPLTRMMKAFQEALVHDLDADGLADMYAQTIAYGLLSARIADPHKKTADDFAGHMRTNPFLRELMETFLKVGGRRGKAGGAGIDFDELGVSEVMDLLDDANMEAVVLDFGDKNPQEDPVIHFYELFLKEYDAKKRMQRGVFYTPRPVVSYIVRSVDELLRTEFGLADGLADTTSWGEMAKRHKDLTIPEGVSPNQDFVQILDPATGTGTFLVEVIDLVQKKLVAKWKAQGHGEEKIDALWNEYVPKHLLTRLHGYELLMAPYAIAHLKIGLKLYETGYRFGSDERARIYLTNALEPAHDFSGRFEFAIPALAHEAQAVNEIKRKRRFTVVIGNPPYSGHSANTGEWISNLVDDYYSVAGERLRERNPKWLQDDYVKFIRLAQDSLAVARAGVLGFITNHSFLDNPTFRGMRYSLLATFSDLYVLDLHGNSKKREKAPDGSADENVFDIQQGVAITIGRVGARQGAGVVRHAHLYGNRTRKYAELLRGTANQTEWHAVSATAPFYLFFPQDVSIREEYEKGIRLPEAMQVNVLGFQSHRDGFAIGFDKAELHDRFAALRSSSQTAKELGARFETSDNSDWQIVTARAQIMADKNWENKIVACAYRPFDIRYCYYSTVAIDRPRRELLNHVAWRENLCLNTTRQTKVSEWRNAVVTDKPAPAVFVELKDGSNVFPLWLYPEQDGLSFSSERRPNFSDTFLKTLAATLQLQQKGPHGIPAGLTPEAIFHYAYAVFYSPGYRSRYAELLKIDFPRLPLTGNLELFSALARLGGELVASHLLESLELDKPVTEFICGRDPEVEKVSWSKNTVWVDKSLTTGFKGVREDVWNFHIGGYQVCEKWLKDRKGRKLSADDVAHYQKIVVALSETIRLMKEIDEVIEQHGGWPGAFQTARSTDAERVGPDVTVVRGSS
jgi:predicted helicase